ncbi:trypsin-like peptidase domain-containing protein [Rhizobium ruizarguesonis]|uniref:trypsin-like peptidase domain-containing protein n=1 Tax=Rhizobium ruizarguesonis TaxID=2081791 RepID=UPI0037CB26C3
MSVNGNYIANGTCFLCRGAGGQPLLITNRHNVTGLDQNTGRPLSTTGGIPDKLSIRHHTTGRAGQTQVKEEHLFHRNSEPRWIEHPTLMAKADFVALPLTNTTGVDLYTYDPSHPGGDEMKIGPTSVVSVVGFPFGLSGGASLAIWATGFIASEPDTDFENLPTFLIDCRTRKGQSGSPVIAYRYGSADRKRYFPGTFSRRCLCRM